MKDLVEPVKLWPSFATLTATDATVVDGGELHVMLVDVAGGEQVATFVPNITTSDDVAYRFAALIAIEVPPTVSTYQRTV